MKIKVLTYEVKMNKKNEAYYLLKCEDKHSYHLPGKLGTPAPNGEYEIEYDETEYEYKDPKDKTGKTMKKGKSKWIKTFNYGQMAQAQAVLGGEVKENKSLGNAVVTNVDSKIWDDAVYLTGCFVTGKDGSLEKMCDMTKEIYNELLSVRKKL